MVTIPQSDAAISPQRAPAVRPAMPGDAGRIAELLGQLGYPASPNDVIARLSALERHEGAVVLVAELDGVVAGVASGHVFPALHSSTVAAWLTSMVVADECRGRGVGRLLVEAVERWAAARGATRLALTSALHRAGAHAFYERLGYEHTGVRLARSLR